MSCAKEEYPMDIWFYLTKPKNLCISFCTNVILLRLKMYWIDKKRQNCKDSLWCLSCVKNIYFTKNKWNILGSNIARGFSMQLQSTFLGGGTTFDQILSKYAKVKLKIVFKCGQMSRKPVKWRVIFLILETKVTWSAFSL